MRIAVPGTLGRPWSPTWPWQGVDWSISYVGFLVYCGVITTYVAPLGQASMIVALAMLPMSGERLRFPPPFLCFLLFFTWAAVSAFNSEYSVAVMEETKALGRVLLITFVALTVLNNRARVRFFIFFYLGCFGLFPLRGALFNQFIYHAATQDRIGWNNIFANSNDLAAYLLCPLGLAAGILFVERNKWLRYCAILGITLIPLVIFQTQSRGAIIALAVATVLVILTHPNRTKLLGMLLVAGVVVSMFAPKSVWKRMTSLTSAARSGQMSQANDSKSAEQRLELWKVARRIIQEKPVTGVGIGAYEYAHLVMARRTEFQSLARGARSAHSSYLETTAETGIPGFIAWASIFVAVMITVVRARKALKSIWPERERELYFLQLALIAFLCDAVFGSWQKIPFTYIHVALLWALADVGMRELEQMRLQRTA